MKVLLLMLFQHALSGERDTLLEFFGNSPKSFSSKITKLWEFHRGNIMFGCRVPFD